MRHDQIEIGSSNTSGDDGAMEALSTTNSMPHVANFGAGATPRVPTRNHLPSSPIPSGGQLEVVNHIPLAASETGAILEMNTTSELPPSQTTRNKFGAGAKDSMPTIAGLPPSPIPSGGHSGYVNQRERAASETGAKTSMHTGKRLPPSPIPSGGQLGFVNHLPHAASETGARDVLTTIIAVPPSPIISQLIDLQRQRLFSIKSQSRCDRSCEAFIAQAIGYSSPKEKDTERSGEKERKALFDRAATVRTAVEKSMKPKKSEGHLGREDQSIVALEACGGDQHILSACTQIIVLSAKSREAWDGLRATAEKQMADLAKSFSAYRWVTTVPGFKELGLAIIIGETGDLSGYATKERVWKRLGLAPYKGRSCSSWAANELTKKEWIEAGYSKRRRGTIAGDIGIPLFFNKSKNAYGSVYTARRAHTAVTHPDWTKGHSDNDARRIMTKALVEDLWRVWNGKEPLNG